MMIIVEAFLRILSYGRHFFNSKSIGTYIAIEMYAGRHAAPLAITDARMLPTQAGICYLKAARIFIEQNHYHF